MKLCWSAVIRLRKAMLLLCMITLSAMQAINADDSEILVIANKASGLSELSKSELRQIYMGGTLSHKYNAVNLPLEDPIRKRFNTSVIGLTENRIQSYWAQLLFTGRSKPPEVLSSVMEVIQLIAQADHTVGYVSSNTPLPENIVVLYRH